MTVWPWPISSPTWKIALETASRTSRFSSSTSGLAAAIMVRAPSSAPDLPPLTGVSMRWMPISASGATSSLTSDGWIVAETMMVAPAFNPFASPSSPKITSLTWSPLSTITKTASLDSPTSRQLAARVPPACSSSARRASRRSNPVSGNPPLMMFRAIPIPMSPRPIIPTLRISSLLLSFLRPGFHLGLLHTPSFIHTPPIP